MLGLDYILLWIFKDSSITVKNIFDSMCLFCWVGDAEEKKASFKHLGLWLGIPVYFVTRKLKTNIQACTVYVFGTNNFS